MTVRVAESQGRPSAAPRCWQRVHNALVPVQEPRMPEPAQLYSLILLALSLHARYPATDRCEGCTEVWPCAQVRLAYRLREGF